MEGRKQIGSSSSSSSSSSFTSELFGSKESYPSSSSGIFGSIFASTSKALGRESVRSEVSGKRQDFASEAWNSKIATPEGTFRRNEGEFQSTPNRDTSSIYQEQKVQPCHLSSSIYYGGQDIYSQPQSTQNTELNSMHKKDGGEDDSGSASRGNWWQGSLYY
ncbi:Plant/T7H20-70 protein [Quillaja saponaria]|uniref:Plant/T7H20-70 protein n=1 Tax=Quillaja saponaria TaxID=32244 RepID=A0AAD7PML6_QUISA|nr:Plant/T7H20-70 protein [Quillaja saponaria]